MIICILPATLQARESQALVRCSHMSVSFGRGAAKSPALNDITFDARQGEFLSVIGPSGCGKTTLLRAVANLIQPTEGTIERVPGERILLVFQEDSLFPWMTVLENAIFGLEMQGVGADWRETKARELLARFGLEGRERAYPHELSVGMKQRVAVIRCFLSDPAVMLMDEPFAALDAQTRLALQQELLALWDQNRKTVIFVTHDIEEAILLSDRILVLNGPPGSIVAELKVPFPRPRDASFTLEEEFLGLKRHIWSKLGSPRIESIRK
jgi:NitT/TauT family transport system ATP-binding protein